MSKDASHTPSCIVVVTCYEFVDVSVTKFGRFCYEFVDVFVTNFGRFVVLFVPEHLNYELAQSVLVSFALNQC